MAYIESLQTLLTPSQWVSVFAVLTTESEMASVGEDHQEIAAIILLSKPSQAVLFTYIPATKKGPCGWPTLSLAPWGAASI